MNLLAKTLNITICLLIPNNVHDVNIVAISIFLILESFHKINPKLNFKYKKLSIEKINTLKLKFAYIRKKVIYRKEKNS